MSQQPPSTYRLLALARFKSYEDRRAACGRGNGIHPSVMPGGLRELPPPATPSTSTENTITTAAPTSTAMYPRAASPNTATVATNNQLNSRLLALPAELRNTIYELVLISPTDIIIPAPSSPKPTGVTTTNLFPAEPALLLTSHQIRHEALKIYYLTNRFRFLVPSFDARSYIAWTAASPSLRKKLSVGLRLVYNPGDARTFWPFLLEWLEALFEKRVKTGPSPQGASNKDWRIAGEMVYLMRRCREMGMGWEGTKGVLEGARAVAAVGDGRWGV